MQIFFNGKELDLNPESKVVITMQIKELGDLSKANTLYTNKFNIPKTANNVAIMNFLGVNGNNSRLPYTLNRVTLLEDSIVLLENGYAEVSGTSDKDYEVNIYGSEKVFFEKIKALTLRDVYPDTIIVWTPANLQPHIESESNFCFPIAQYADGTYHTPIEEAGTMFPSFTVTDIKEISPHFFIKNLFENIFSYLGYTLVYPIANDPVFAKMVTPSQRGVSYFGVNHGTPFNIKNCVHDTTCDTLIKEILYRFGMIFQVDEFNKKITFTKLDTLIRNGKVIDWTNKVDSFKNEKYNMGNYAQRNFFKYGEDIPDEKNAASVQDEMQGYFDIDNKVLDVNTTVIESVVTKATFFGHVIKDGRDRGQIVFKNPTVIYPLLNVAENVIDDKGIKKNRVNPFQFQYLKNIPTTEAYNFHINSQVVSGIYPVTPRICTNENLSFQSFINSHYPQITNLLNNVVIVKAIMKLTLLDIYNFDFSSRIYLEQYGSYFYVNKITNFQKNKLTEVELVKIPPVTN